MCSYSCKMTVEGIGQATVSVFSSGIIHIPRESSVLGEEVMKADEYI